MAGRIRDEDVAAVRERSPISEVVAEYVQLRGAGGGSMKGLCPFHEEKTASFQVTPARGLWYCFGCAEGGDVFGFIQKIEHIGFSEAVERLARRANVELRYDEGSSAPRSQTGQRTRLVEAHKAAAQYYAEQLASAEASTAREFLASRGFDQTAAEHFGVGYAPKGWDALLKHLRARGFTDADLITSGLARAGQRGPIDHFRGRLLWPIRDTSGDVIGFGARRLYDDDRNEAKYVNTPETPLYKKSTVLYGVDLARKEIAKRRQAVVVEGYTDVMACHLAGVTTAVASCGTAFGAEHVKVLRRFLMDQDEFRGEVIYTFDGDAAGQKAALKAYDLDEKFVTQTFVAVEPRGLDPCDLRVQHGDAAVRELVARRVPLFEYAIRAALADVDLSVPEGRARALDKAIPIVGRIRDVSLRDDYARQLAGWVGVPDPNEVVARLRERAGGVPPQRGRSNAERARDDRAVSVEREALKLALQRPDLVDIRFDELGEEVFTAPEHRAAQAAIDGAGGAKSAPEGEAWTEAVLAAASDDAVRNLVLALSVEPPLWSPGGESRYATAVLARLEELHATREVTELKGRLQRVNPVDEEQLYNQLFGRLVALEQQARALREEAAGTL
ncbi:MAG: primase [Frankiales bacterium]|nr:primase [Frankiales bacterium]